MDFKLYKRPKFSVSGHYSMLIIRMLFLGSLFLILGLSFSYNKVNRELIYFSDRVDNMQHVRLTLAELSEQIYFFDYRLRSANKGGIRKSEKDQQHQQLIDLADQLDILVMKGEIEPEGYSELVELIAPLVIAIKERQSTKIKNGLDVTRLHSAIEKVKASADRLLEMRMKSRDNYKSQIFSYNWAFVLITFAFMAITFYLLDRELLKNRTYRVELESKIENLNRSNNELEQFAYSASHDLQEPLRKISSFVQRIETKHQNEVSTNVADLLQRIGTSAVRMQQLIQDLLSYSQLVKHSADKQGVALNKVLREVQSNLSLIIAEKKASITLDDLPTIQAYPAQMTQLFQNLIGNSLKYAKPEVAPAIGVTYQRVLGAEIVNSMPAHKDVSFHAITVTDNGIGFGDEYAERIFGMFQRLHGRGKYEGTGIGLSICRRVVSNHNGYIQAQGIIDLGASFTVYLPVEEGKV